MPTVNRSNYGRMNRHDVEERVAVAAYRQFWTYCTAVLKYINNETRFRIPANRVSKTPKMSTAAQFKHISTHLKPADCSLRGQKGNLFL